MTTIAAIADVGSVVEDGAFWALLAVIVGIGLGAWLGASFRHAVMEQLADENDTLRAALIDAYRAISDPEETERRTTVNLRREIRGFRERD